MKLVLAVILLLISFGYLSSKVISAQAGSNPKKDIEIIFTAHIDSFVNKKDSVTHLQINTTIKNNLKDTLSYWDCPCTRQYIYFVSTKDFTVQPFNCKKIIDSLVKIPPGDSVSSELTLNSKKTSAELSGAQFKIGYYLSQTINSITELPVGEVSDTMVLWSNTLTIK